MALRDDGRWIVSYSETKMWSDCPHRWRAFYQLGARNIPELNPPSQALAWGSSFHDALEQHLLGNEHDFKERWNKEAQDVIQAGIEIDDGFREKVELHSEELIQKMPAWLDEQFGNWTLLGTEVQFELPTSVLCAPFDITDKSGAYVKGFIDLIIMDGKGKIWLLDWKTSEKGWSPFKRRDEDTPKQLQLYKACFLAALKDAGVSDDIKSMSRRVGTEYVIVRPRSDERCFERFPVTSGEGSMGSTVKWLQKAVRGMQMGINLQNVNSCRFCPLKDKREWCDVVHSN